MLCPSITLSPHLRLKSKYYLRTLFVTSVLISYTAVVLLTRLGGGGGGGDAPDKYSQIDTDLK